MTASPTERIPAPRIYRVTYRAIGTTAPGRRRKVTAWIKVPYGGLFGLTETLDRAMATGQIAWFRIDVARPGEITNDIRTQLVRWNVALERGNETVEVRWSA